MICCTVLYVHSSFAIILMWKRGTVALLSLSSWCLEVVVRLFLAVPWVCLQFFIVVFSDHTHVLLFGQRVPTLITVKDLGDKMHCTVHLHAGTLLTHFATR